MFDSGCRGDTGSTEDEEKDDGEPGCGEYAGHGFAEQIS
jgi:hypothetical protein